jgi:peptidoglycan/xylan/chitin deacetylase (PgdA/CDA1 family)
VRTSFLDLAPLCNVGLDTAIIPAQEGWSGLPIPEKTLGGFPLGERAFAGVPFRVGGSKGAGNCLLCLPGADQAERKIEVGATAAALYALHTMDCGDLGRSPVAYTFHYADGGSEECLVQVGRDVGDWLLPRGFDNCRVAWTGYHPDNEYQKSVYVTEIVNPRPKEKIQAISLRRNEPYGLYMLLGLTLSNDRPIFASSRKNASSGLTPQILLPDGDVLRLKDGALRIEAAVVDEAGRRVAGASLAAVIDGQSHPFKESAGGHTLSLPREKAWRKYANAARLGASRAGKTLAERDVVFYCEGVPRSLKPPHGKKPPQFIIIAFDDCRSLLGVEAMLSIIENLKAAGASAPMTMFTSPCESRSQDIHKMVLLYQRMHDLGCEFCNHTLNHNPRGMNWFALSPKEQTREISGCRDWLREHIHGLWHVYSQKSGGGGAAGFRDPKFTRDLMRSQQFEYVANNVTMNYMRSLPHPDLQLWPYLLGDEWAIDGGLLDGNAPPVHKPITKGFYTDYSGKFDYPAEEGIAMMVANFDYRYRGANRPPFIVNAFHEWGLMQYFGSHHSERAILEGFLMEVLVKQKKKYPDAHVITFHQLIEYMRRDDLPAILAEGSGQGKKD